MKKFTLILILLPALAFGQQNTIRVMHYNLLHYAHTTSYCTSQNNNLQAKDSALQEIISFTNPHIFTVNEVGSSNFAQERVLNTVLNSSGRNYYEMGSMKNISGSSIENMLYYDKRMFGVASQDAIGTTVRDIDIYKLYFKAKDLSLTNDTAFLTCFVTHLKAGSSTSDEQLRSSVTATMMNYIENNDIDGDFLLLGDLNLKSSYEQAYQNIVNYSNSNYRLYDPVNTSGSWNDNSSYSHLHTQSTHYNSNGCASGGGLDDRFDFILTSESINNQNGHYRYETGSYNALGNDGQHFDDAVNYGPNSSVPADVLNALYVMSDHLPVRMNLNVDQAVRIKKKHSDPELSINNPVKRKIKISAGDGYKPANIHLYSLSGKNVYSETMQNNSSVMNISDLQSSFYIIEIIMEDGSRARKKIIKI